MDRRTDFYLFIAQKSSCNPAWTNKKQELQTPTNNEAHSHFFNVTWHVATVHNIFIYDIMMLRSSIASFTRRQICRHTRETRFFSAISSDALLDSMLAPTKDLALSITTEKGPMLRRLALSRAITMMESKKAEIKQQADYLLTYLLAKRPKEQRPTIRIGFAGPPGSGKSSMIEAFGMHLLQNDPNLHLAAVCIDPSSGISGGSILGDKTRMTELSRNERAYVRPSSNSGVLGGLAACKFIYMASD